MFRPNVKHTLVTFQICPFCIRVKAIMHLKQIDIEVKYIEIANKPDWFLEKSPLGKVPILIIGDNSKIIFNLKVVLFESNVIMEYLDELVKPQLLPGNPVEKAVDRARCEFANEVIKVFHQFAFACEQDKFFKSRDLLFKYFEKIETWLQDGKYMNGNDLSLVDISYSPVFLSLSLILPTFNCEFQKKLPKTYEYCKAIVNLPCVQKAKRADYEQLVLNGIRQCNTFICLTFFLELGKDQLVDGYNLRNSEFQKQFKISFNAASKNRISLNRW
ncbi:hypothetical protein pb186bvf_000050 [Paramecium bursaria]